MDTEAIFFFFFWRIFYHDILLGYLLLGISAIRISLVENFCHNLIACFLNIWISHSFGRFLKSLVTSKIFVNLHGI